MAGYMWAEMSYSKFAYKPQFKRQDNKQDLCDFNIDEIEDTEFIAEYWQEEKEK